MTDEKDLAFAEVLYQKARTRAGGLSSYNANYIEQARNGRYRSGNIRPGFLYDQFGMTEQEWDALWALIYG
jgi:hypothetical protein